MIKTINEINENKFILLRRIMTVIFRNIYVTVLLRMITTVMFQNITLP
jgi:hypothetical protein